MNAELRGRVARVLKNRRAAQGLSLSELSRMSGVAKATLSALEAGDANPTLDTLWSLASALKVPLGELVEPEEPTLHVVRAGDGTVVRGVAVTARLIQTVEAGGSRLEMYDATVKMKRQISPAHANGVTEHLFISAGKLRVGPVEAPVELAEGDYLRMSPDWPHLYEALTKDARFFLVMQYR